MNIAKMWITLAALINADYLCTSDLINTHGIYVESNEWMRLLFSYDLWPALVFKTLTFVILFFAFKAWKCDMMIKKAILSVLIALYASVVIYSLALIFLDIG